MKKIKPCVDLYAICAPEGDLIHTTVATTEEDSIAEFMDLEKAMNWLKNIYRQSHGKSKACASSWEGFEAEGYSVELISLEPQKEILEKSLFWRKV